ncbi:MAG TPA: type II secretion system protein [Candidatus Paceibacterota bacterium]|nr:type II secretion system protein [Candidatus Paceibacterota bacterium]
MKKKSQNGFTLIELLVVIAIIGILASIVLASLNSARNKGTDAKIKAELSNARAQAELYYDDNTQSYSGVCTADSTATPGGIQNMVADAATATGASSVGTGAFSTTPPSAVCHDSADGWAAMVSLKAPATAGDGYCVDSTGASEETDTLGATSVTCGS